MSNKSNKELSTDIAALAKRLGREVTTDGLKNPELVALAEELTGLVAALPPEAPPEQPGAKPRDGAESDSLGGPPAPPPTAPSPVRFPWQVADGVSITTRRGVLAPGEEITADDLADGVKQLEHLASQKLVVKGPRAS